MNKTFLLLIIFCFYASACSVGPAYKQPWIEVPSEWKNSSSHQYQSFETNEAGELVYLDNWWQVFDDEKLEELEKLALQNNRDLYVACERVQEAQALRGIATSQLYPQLTLNPLYTNTGELIKNYNITGTETALANTVAPAIVNPLTIFRAHELLYMLPVNLSYEVDLWGKIRDQYHSATYNWLAQKKDYEAVMLTLTTNLAIAYYQLRANDTQIDLLTNILKTRQKAYEINEARYEGKITFYADVTLAAEEVDSAIVQYHEALRQRQLLENQIAVLIGMPASEFSLEHMPLKGIPPSIPAGIPSEILLRRPDIAEAEYQVRSQHFSVKQAYSLFFPSLILTGSGGFESPIFKDFLKWISRYWMMGAQINQLIFDGFKTTSNLELQIARFREASGEYQQEVLTAFQEVEDALKNIEAYAKEYEAAVATTKWAQKTYNLYHDRYTLGVIYYIDVANTERDLLNFQITQNSLQGLRYIATIQLIKALGGGWDIPIGS